MGLSFKKRSGGGGGSGTAPVMGGHRGKAPKVPDAQDLGGNALAASLVKPPEEEVSPLLAAPKQAAKSAPIEQPAVRGAMPALPALPVEALRGAPKQAAPSAAIEQPAVQGALQAAPKQAAKPSQLVDLPAVGGASQVAKVAPSRPSTPAPQLPAAAAPKAKKKGIFSGLGRKKKAPLEQVGDKDVKKSAALNSGTAHDVTSVKTKGKIGTSGQKKGFFKADPEREEAASAVSAGIGQWQGDSHMAARSVASSRVDQMLGTNVLTDDRFAMIKGKQGLVSPMSEGEQLAKKKWSGISKSDYDEAYAPMGPDWAKEENGAHFKYDGMSCADVDLSRPETQKSMADLGVNDYLSGQVDRHMGNVFIDPKTGKAKGIDNDMAFGTEDYTQKSGKNGIKGLPEMVDEGTAERLLSLDQDEYEQTLRGKQGDMSKLSEEEIAQAMKRFGDMREHVGQLKKDGGLIKNWDASTFAKSEADQAKMTDIDMGSNLMARAIDHKKSAVGTH